MSKDRSKDYSRSGSNNELDKKNTKNLETVIDLSNLEQPKGQKDNEEEYNAYSEDEDIKIEMSDDNKSSAQFGEYDNYMEPIIYQDKGYSKNIELLNRLNQFLPSHTKKSKKKSSCFPCSSKHPEDILAINNMVLDQLKKELYNISKNKTLLTKLSLALRSPFNEDGTKKTYEELTNDQELIEYLQIQISNLTEKQINLQNQVTENINSLAESEKTRFFGKITLALGILTLLATAVRLGLLIFFNADARQVKFADIFVFLFTGASGLFNVKSGFDSKKVADQKAKEEIEKITTNSPRKGYHNLHPPSLENHYHNLYTTSSNSSSPRSGTEELGNVSHGSFSYNNLLKKLKNNQYWLNNNDIYNILQTLRRDYTFNIIIARDEYHIFNKLDIKQKQIFLMPYYRSFNKNNMQENNFGRYYNAIIVHNGRIYLINPDNHLPGIAVELKEKFEDKFVILYDNKTKLVEQGTNGIYSSFIIIKHILESISQDEILPLERNIDMDKLRYSIIQKFKESKSPGNYKDDNFRDKVKSKQDIDQTPEIITLNLKKKKKKRKDTDEDVTVNLAI